MVNFRILSGKFTPGRKIYTDGVSRVSDNYQVCCGLESPISLAKVKSLRDSIDAQQLQYEKLKALHPGFTMFAKF